MNSYEHYLEKFKAKFNGYDGGEHPDYPKQDWKYEVNNGDTELGYWNWAFSRNQSEILGRMREQ